jgi:hypothetical protein
MRELLTKVFRRAGCGKSARPVRRGGGGPQIYSVTLRPTLLAIVFLRPGAKANHNAFRHINTA